MKIQNKKLIFKITVNGLEEWIEDAAGRSLLEVQHRLATQTYPGASVRVRRQFVTEATEVKRQENDDDQDEP